LSLTDFVLICLQTVHQETVVDSQLHRLPTIPATEVRDDATLDPRRIHQVDNVT
jgi:hypothetical protein